METESSKPKLNIPLFEGNMRRCFQVLAYPKNMGSDQNGWTPLNSSYRYPYEYKGFAINKCLTMMRQGWWGKKALFCVVELSRGRIVWQSWNDYEEQANGK